MQNALDRVRGEVGRQVSSAHGRGLWTGGNADRYVADWRGSDARVRDLVRAVHDFARHLREQARQRDASRASGALRRREEFVADAGPRPMAPKFPPSVHDYRDLAGAAYIGGSVPSPYQEVTGDELRRMGLRRATWMTLGQGFTRPFFATLPEIMWSPSVAPKICLLGNSPDRNEDAIGTVALTRQGESRRAAGASRIRGRGPRGVHGTFARRPPGVRREPGHGAPAVTFNAAGLGDEEAMYAMVASGKDVSLFDYVGRGFGLGSIAQQMTDAERSGQITNYRTTLGSAHGSSTEPSGAEGGGHQTTVPGLASTTRATSATSPTTDLWK